MASTIESVKKSLHRANSPQSEYQVLRQPFALFFNYKKYAQEDILPAKFICNSAQFNRNHNTSIANHFGVSNTDSRRTETVLRFHFPLALEEAGRKKGSLG